MKFEEYQQKFHCKPFNQTEQSWTFVVERNGEKRVVKRYPSTFDRCREELAYCYINAKELLNVSQPNLWEEDFMEVEFLDSIGNPKLEEIIQALSSMYTKTNGISHPKGYFPRLDLSKEKLIHRLEYLPGELAKRNALDLEMIKDSEKFVESRYLAPPHQCLVHGDLKSPHIIKTEKGVILIDLALVSVASPWYDLSFLFMEQRDRRGYFEKLSLASFNVLGQIFKLTKEEIKEYLISSIFYRSLYDVGFAARNRKDKTLNRTIKDLKEILKGRAY